MSCFPYKQKKESSGENTSIILIISIVISALIVRAIYTVFEYIKTMSDECVDGKPDDYEEMICGFIRTLLVVAICVFIIILIYEFMKRHYHK